MKKKRKNVLPGFGLTLGYSVFYISIILLLPLSMVVMKTCSLSWTEFVEIVTDPRVVEAYKLSFGASIIAALINCIFGLIVAWTLVRYNFTGKKFIDSLIDLPFALPTAVAGISLTTIFSPNGLLGSYLETIGIKVAFTPIGIIICLVFIGLPFVVRTVQPVLEDFDKEVEEAAQSLNASRLIIFWRIIFPEAKHALITGTTLAFARALGEYGSVVFISGNMPYKTEIVPLLIMTKLEQFDYTGANAIAAMMLFLSLILLLTINFFQLKTRKT